MFIESITQPSDAWHEWSDKLRITDDPPDALVASIAWNSGDGMVTAINVWDHPGAVSDFYVERILPIIKVEGEPTHKPNRHGEPIAVYTRP